MKLDMLKKLSICVFAWSTAVLLALCVAPVRADVKLPNGEYRETVTDMKVKVLGGYVMVERAWIADALNKGEYRWYFNPAWADLRFEYDDLDGSVKAVRRADSTFERAGNDIYVFDRIYFIGRQLDANGNATGWRWFDRKGNWIRYANDGRIVAYGDRNDVTIGFVRDAQGRIRTVTDPNGHPVLTFEYADGKLASVTDRANRKVSYRYEGSRLAEVVDVGDNLWSYGYTNGLLTSKTDAEQRTTTIGYSGNRVVSVENPLRRKTTYEYAFDKGKRQYTVVKKSPKGRRIEQRYDADGRLLLELHGTRQVFSLVRSGEFVHIHRDEGGLQTRIEFDTRFNPTKVTYADGTTVTATYDTTYNLPLEYVDEKGTKTVFEYDRKGNLTKQTEARGTNAERVTTSTYDDYGQTLTRTVAGVDAVVGMTYDEYGNTETFTDAEGRTSTFTYDVAGHAISRKDPRGKSWSATYSPQGWLKTTRDPLSNVVEFRYDDVGNLGEQIDQEGKSTLYGHFDDDLPKSVTDAAGGVTAYGYDDDGNLTSVTDANGVAVTYSYDSDGRVTGMSDAEGNATVLQYEGTGTTAGLIRRIRYPTYCENFGYDQRQRVTRVDRFASCDDDARTSEAAGYDAAGNMISRTDALQRTSLFEFDALDRLVRATDANGGAVETAYDALDNVVMQKNAAGGEYRFSYYKDSALKSDMRPSGETISYVYDASGNVERRTSARGERRQFRYDDAGRRTHEIVFEADANLPARTHVFSLDKRGLLKGYVQSGDTQSSAEYELDAVGRRTAELVTFGAGPSAFSRRVAGEFYKNGLRKSFSYADGARSELDYWPNNRIKSATVPGGGAIGWSDYRWRVARRVEMAGAVRSVEPDALQRIVGIKVSAAGADPVLDLKYAYDDAGNPVALTTTQGSHAFAYDKLDRLVESIPPPASMRSSANPNGLDVERYSYDSVHNRQSSESQPGTWNYDGDNRLLGYGLAGEARRFEYDANGNTVRIEKGSPSTSDMRLHYDGAERVREVVRDGVTIGRYQYDPFGRRIRKETSAGVTWFQYDGNDLVAEYSGDGENTVIYGWQPRRDSNSIPLWQARKVEGAWQVAYVHNDNIGVPQKLTDSTGAVVWSGTMREFGRVDVAVGSIVRNPFRYPGQYFDDETGLHYNMHRSFDPGTGRYIESDPLGIVAGVNVYGYVAANPRRFTDPLGLKCDQCTDNSFWPNGAKVATSLANMGLAVKALATGTVRLGVGFGLMPAAGTGVGALPPALLIPMGLWNFKGFHTSLKTSLQLMHEAFCEDPSDARWKNLLGIVPMGTHFDDPGEPGPLEYVKQLGAWKTAVNIFPALGAWL